MDLASGWAVGRAIRPAKSGGRDATKLTVRFAGTFGATGNDGHGAARSDGPASESGATSIMAQWCLPARRQQGGRFDSSSDANTAGLSSEKPKSAISKPADMRCIAMSVHPW